MAIAQNALQIASIALQEKDFKKAESILDKINGQSDQRTLRSLLMHGNALEALENFDEAASTFRAAEEMAAESQEKAKILRKASMVLLQKSGLTTDDMEQIADWLEQSVLLDPSEASADADINLCRLYYVIHKYSAVIVCANRLLNFPAYRVSANLWLAQACYSLGERTQGLVHLSELENIVASLDEHPQRRLLGLLIDYQCFTQADAILNQISTQRNNSAWFQDLRAKVHYQNNNYDKALKILSDTFIFTRLLKGKKRAQAMYSLRANILQSMGDYKAAHEDFKAMNQLARDKYGKTTFDNTLIRYSELSLKDLPVFQGSQSLPYIPVFMIGFPRSGTTLLDTILETQKDIRTLSEVGGIVAVRQEITRFGKTYPDELASLTEQEIDRLRNIYYQHNTQFISADTHFSVLVDKLPMNIIHLPLIKTLFPEAKCIFSLRHPVDVCLSCFQQDFSLNDAMFHFTDLEQSFIRYRNVMTLFESYRTKLDLNLLTVRYEDLIADLDNVAGEVFNFLGIQANKSYRDFHKFNQEKIIATPSRTQVSKPLYKSSRYRWKNYEDQLKPYIPLVQQFISQYGYSV
jgi:tetratricopeptide (TPR) repeat protein